MNKVQNGYREDQVTHEDSVRPLSFLVIRSYGFAIPCSADLANVALRVEPLIRDKDSNGWKVRVGWLPLFSLEVAMRCFL